MEQKSKEEVILKKDGRLLSLCWGSKITKFDFKDKKFISFTGREIKVSTLRSQLSKKKLNREMSDEKYVKLFDFISRHGSRSWSFNLSNLGSIVSLLPRFTEEEKYISLGFKVESNLSEYMIEDLKKVPKNIKNICLKRGISVGEMSTLKTKSSQLYIEEMDRLLDSDEEFEFHTHYLVSSRYSTSELDYIDELYNLYSYKIKSLCKYILNIYNYEAMNKKRIAEYLVDYLKMSTLMGATKINKYPKYLHTTHDIVVRNFNSFKLDRDDSMWDRLVNHNLEFSKGNYCIIYPKSYKEIQSEGANLHHCVASYVDRVFNLKCDIVFLRYADKPEESLVTVEIVGGSIVQYRGSYNRNLTEEEKDFLKCYAENKNLNLK